MYYILYDLKTLKVKHIYTKPLTAKVCDNFYKINGIAEYHGINGLPKGDYLTVSNIHEEVETWKEKETQYKTITELEPQTRKKVVFEEKETLNEDGMQVTFKVPKVIKETIEVEVEKEVEEEIEVEKSKTHIVCDLVAHFYPKIELTEEQKAKQKEKTYEALCEKYIREKYTLSDELKLARQSKAYPDNAEYRLQFLEYNAYVESCLLRAKEEVYTKNI